MTVQNLKLKVIPKFPSAVTVGTGLTLTSNGGAYTIGLDADLAAIAVLPTPGAKSVLNANPGTPAWTTAPTIAGLTINNNAANLPAPPTSTVYQVGNADAFSTVGVYDTFGTGVASGVQFRKARGTATAPSAIQLDDPIGSVSALGYGASGYSTVARGYFGLIAGGNWTDASQPTYAVVATTPVGSTTVTERTRVNPDGTLKWSAYSTGVIKSDASGNLTAGNAIDVVTATTSGTWTKPAGAKRVYVELVGGGGGGGGGARQASGSATSGGGGGGGACIASGWFDATSLSATEAYTIGAGGNGGAVQTTNATAGNAGTAGGSSTFKTLTAFAGGFGAGGQLAANSGGGGGAGSISAGGNASGSTAGTGGNVAAGAGGAGAVGQSAGSAAGGGGGGSNGAAGNVGGSTGFLGSAAGGSGGGVTAGAAFTAGGAGGSTVGNNGAAGGAADGAVGAALSQSISNLGAGGGGGASSVLTAGGAGSAGQTPGGGGGGGGSALNGQNGGAGGGGGTGWIRITTYL